MRYGAMLTQYRKTNVETATGLELVVMCYEHAIRFIREAKQYYERREYLEKGRALQRALDIINELKCSIDFERGGQIANNLESIYNFIIKSLLEADIQRNLDLFDTVSDILSELKEAWEALALRPVVHDQDKESLSRNQHKDPIRAHGGVAV